MLKSGFIPRLQDMLWMGFASILPHLPLPPSVAPWCLRRALPYLLSELRLGSSGRGTVLCLECCLGWGHQGALFLQGKAFSSWTPRLGLNSTTRVVWLSQHSLNFHFSFQMPLAVFQFSSAQLCLTPCNSMDCSMPGFLVHHQLLEPTKTHVHCVGDAIQPSHPLSSPSPPTFNLPQHQGLFQWVSSCHQVAKSIKLCLIADNNLTGWKEENLVSHISCLELRWASWWVTEDPNSFHDAILFTALLGKWRPSQSKNIFIALGFIPVSRGCLRGLSLNFWWSHFPEAAQPIPLSVSYPFLNQLLVKGVEYWRVCLLQLCYLHSWSLSLSFIG